MQNEVVGYCVNSGSRGFANSTQYGASPHSNAAGLNQIWTNRIDNAIDAAPAEGGQLSITTGISDGRIFVTIGDNGSGIALYHQADGSR